MTGTPILTWFHETCLDFRYITTIVVVRLFLKFKTYAPLRFPSSKSVTSYDW
jgi:hypothetical protein